MVIKNPFMILRKHHFGFFEVCGGNVSIIPETSTQMILWKKLCNMGNYLFGEITSFQLLNAI